jgi:putative acetyltransferase
MIEYEASLPPDLRHGHVPKAKTLRLAYQEPNAAFLATNEKSAAGCVAVTRLDASRALMLRLFVKRSYRGRGVARELVKATVEFLRDRRYARVVLDTDKTRLPAAYNLYRSLGFRECEAYGAVEYEAPTYMELWL